MRSVFERNCRYQQRPRRSLPSSPFVAFAAFFFSLLLPLLLCLLPSAQAAAAAAAVCCCLLLRLLLLLLLLLPSNIVNAAAAVACKQDSYLLSKQEAGKLTITRYGGGECWRNGAGSSMAVVRFCEVTPSPAPHAFLPSLPSFTSLHFTSHPLLSPFNYPSACPLFSLPLFLPLSLFLSFPPPASPSSSPSLFPSLALSLSLPASPRPSPSLYLSLPVDLVFLVWFFLFNLPFFCRSVFRFFARFPHRCRNIPVALPAAPPSFDVCRTCC